MREFDYSAIDREGRLRDGRLRAEDSDGARAALTGQRLHVVRLASGSAAGAVSTPPLLSRSLARPARLSARRLALFTRQLATLAVVTPLDEALRIIARQEERPAQRALLGNVQAGVVEGRRLSDALAREPRSFPPLYRAMVAAGEAAGTLPAILERLAALLERQAQVRAKILTTLAYPLVLAVVAIGVVAALMLFVVPQVVTQFDDVGQRLPLLTRMVIGLSDLLVACWWLLLLASGVAIAGGWFVLRGEARRLAFDRRLLGVPFAGRLIRDLHAARLARNLATMVAGRLPLIEGLALTVPTVRNRALRAASIGLIETVRGGGTLSGGLRRAGVFPPLLCLSGGVRRGGGATRYDAGAGRRISGAGVRQFHRHRAGAARAGYHPRHGLHSRADRAVDSAAYPAAQHSGDGMRTGMTKRNSAIDRATERGFTLIELMVVIVIIGLLTTVVMMNVMPSRDKAMVEKARADVALLEQAVERYRLDNLAYPSTSEGLAALLSAPAGSRADRYPPGGYIKRLPRDPWGNDYRYVAPGRKDAFDIYSLGADGREGGESNDADIGTWQ